jgi:hypothetical protein
MVINSFSYGQDQCGFSIIIDVEIIQFKVDSLLNDSVKEVVVIQTIKPFEFLHSEDSCLTFICWKAKQEYFTQIITDKFISPAIYFNGQSIFNFKDKKLAFVTPDERILKFTPPIEGGNAVYYFTKKSKRYFELTGSNTQPGSYVPNNKKKEEIRMKWFNIIYKTLFNEHFNLEIKSNYDRWKEIYR